MRRARTIVLVILPVLVGHLFLPLTLVAHLWSSTAGDWPTWLSMVYFAGGYCAFIYMTGAWSWFGEVTRGLLVLLLLLAAVTTLPRGGVEAALSGSEAIELGLRVALGTLFVGLFIRALLGRRLREQALELRFPLRGGTFVVGQGGANRLVNYHFAHPSQRYALDLLQLNRAGVRARGLYPARPERYAVFGAEVVSPCDARVAAAEDAFPDFSPPERDPEHRAGNHVALERDGATLYLCHLMRGSVCVKVGERVRAGEVVGRVGNSGNTTEPHLHIHAEKGPYPGQFSGKPGVPLRFGGRFLVRNDRVKAPALPL